MTLTPPGGGHVLHTHTGVTMTSLCVAGGGAQPRTNRRKGGRASGVTIPVTGKVITTPSHKSENSNSKYVNFSPRSPLSSSAL